MQAFTIYTLFSIYTGFFVEVFILSVCVLVYMCRHACVCMCVGIRDLRCLWSPEESVGFPVAGV